MVLIECMILDETGYDFGSIRKIFYAVFCIINFIRLGDFYLSVFSFL